jgi:hypothetical protein
MKGHIHSDVITVAVTSVFVFTFAHVMRIMGAYAGSHGMKTLGTAVGAFFSLPGK